MTNAKIFRFWAPLAATWMMMSFEGPFIAAIIARLADAKYNLAAYGVAFSFGLIVEAPIIMIMSASVALAKDYNSFRKLKKFTNTLNIIITLLMLVLIYPPIFKYLTCSLMDLPEDLSHLIHMSTMLMLPWPGAIGYRRFYQGLLIRNNQTRKVAYGTCIRLCSMTAAALTGFFFHTIPGAYIGCAALSFGVMMEAAAARWMAGPTVRQLRETSPETITGIAATAGLTYQRIINFYYPLALSSIIGLSVNPMVSFFIGHSRYPIESLAVLPVVNSLQFLFTCLGLSFQEAAIALLGKHNEFFHELKKFAGYLAVSLFIMISLLAFTPLSLIWFERISGLTHELSGFAVDPLRLVTILPATMVLMSFQRALLVNNRRTRPITYATIIEVAGILITLYICIHSGNMTGAIAASLAYVTGRVAANVYLLRPLYC
jgi:progressive ankylosis protein